jgi:N-acetylneuraminic acid mutarotase
LWDQDSERFVLMGGNDEPDFDTGDEIWTASADGERWRLVGTLEPGDLDAAVYHSRRDRIVVWVSTRYRPEGGGDVPDLSIDLVAETWTYDLDRNAWHKLQTHGSPPAGIVGARMSYDSESDRIVLFGGFDFATFTFNSDTWVLDLRTRTWTNMSPATHPTGRNFHGQVYHAASDRVLTISGFDESFTVSNDVWSYDYNTNTWTEIESPDAPARDYVGVAYMDRSERVLVFGGLEPYGPDFEEISRNEAWEYDLRRNRWRQIEPEDEAPGPRAWHSMGYSDLSDEVLVFGGGVDRLNLNNEAWAYDPREEEWERRR